MLLNHTLSYFIPGYVQNDRLEEEFGIYRQSSDRYYRLSRGVTRSFSRQNRFLKIRKLPRNIESATHEIKDIQRKISESFPLDTLKREFKLRNFKHRLI